MSYANVILYGAVLPSYDSKRKDKDKGAKKQKEIKVDDPANKDEVRKIFDSFD